MVNIRFEGFQSLQRGDRIELDKTDIWEKNWFIVMTDPYLNDKGIYEIVAERTGPIGVLKETLY